MNLTFSEPLPDRIGNTVIDTKVANSLEKNMSCPFIRDLMGHSVPDDSKSGGDSTTHFHISDFY